MLKKSWKAGSHLVLLALAAVLLLLVCAKSNQASDPMPLASTFQGEYSWDGTTWLPLGKSTELSALDGDLFIRGSLNAEIPEGIIVNYYLDHITYCVYLNGEFVTCSADWEMEPIADLCAAQWSSFASPGIGSGDVLEFHLHNPHRLGNAGAYSEFLNSFHLGPMPLWESALSRESLPYRIVGILIIILSIGIIGIALAFSCMRMPQGGKLWLLGLMSLFAGGFIMLDTRDISLWSSLLVFNTYARQLCLMLAPLELQAYLALIFTTKAKKAAQIAVGAEGSFLAVLLVLCMTGRVLIYDTLPLWILVQLIVCPALMGCCIYEWRKLRQRPPVMLLSGALLLLTVMLEYVNVFFSWWPEGIISKTAFVILFVFHLARGLQEVQASYQKAAQADKLADDLKNSRIILAASQIRTHFIFNILNAISGMCKYDPEKADRLSLAGPAE